VTAPTLVALCALCGTGLITAACRTLAVVQAPMIGVALDVRQDAGISNASDVTL
jgi:hypothetical protein